MTPGSWQYAMWVAVDARLLLFAFLFSALIAAGLSSFFVRSGRKRDWLSFWFLAAVLCFALTLWTLDALLGNPAFIIESFFDFP